MTKAVFPGSFDPITNAHVDVVERALDLFDKVYVAVGTNTTKKGFFNHDIRLAMIRETFATWGERVEAVQFTGLTVDFCRRIEARFLVRGIRNTADFEFEKAIALNNRVLAPDIDTVFLISGSHLSHVSSTIVREILINGGDVSLLVPQPVVNAVSNNSAING